MIMEEEKTTNYPAVVQNIIGWLNNEVDLLEFYVNTSPDVTELRLKREGAVAFRRQALKQLERYIVRETR